MTARTRGARLRFEATVFRVACGRLVSATAAWFATELILPGGIPVFAAIAAVMVTQTFASDSLARAIERTSGVIIGGIAGTVLLVAQPIPDPLGIVLLTAVSSLLPWVLRMPSVASVQVVISALSVVALHEFIDDYAVDRIIQTALGASIGAVVALMLPHRGGYQRAVAEVEAAELELVDGLTLTALRRAANAMAMLDAARRQPPWLRSSTRRTRSIDELATRLEAALVRGPSRPSVATDQGVALSAAMSPGNR